LAPSAILDRWILSRTASAVQETGNQLTEFDARRATVRIGQHIDELSTWYLRRSRRRISRNPDEADRNAAFATLHAALVGQARMMAPILPFLSEELYQRLVVEIDPSAPDSVHLTGWPGQDFADQRDEPLEAAMDTVLRVVELARTLRGQAGLRLRQPLRQMWLAVPGGRLAPHSSQDEKDLLTLLADETNVKAVTVLDDESDLVERRVRPLLPKIGKRLGGRTQDVLAAARSNEVEHLPDGSVRLAGVELAADEVEIIATPRSGTAVAHDRGLVVVIDTEIDDELRAEGDARELSRAVQDLRKQAGLELDETVDLWLSGGPTLMQPLAPYLPALAEDTLTEVQAGDPPSDAPSAEVELGAGTVAVAIQRRGSEH
jgi:isoleucyl-tRNA synthetase